MDKEMLIHFIPRLYQQKKFACDLLDFTCPELDLRLEADKDLKVGWPFPNTRYTVVCRKTVRKAVAGFFVSTSRRLRAFTTITRWRLGYGDQNGDIIKHQIWHDVLDEDFDTLSEETMIWQGQSCFNNDKDASVRVLWPSCWPKALNGVTPAVATPTMAIVHRDNRKDVPYIDCVDVLGRVIERREILPMPTIERDRLLFDYGWPLPNIKDAFKIP